MVCGGVCEKKESRKEKRRKEDESGRERGKKKKKKKEEEEEEEERRGRRRRKLSAMESGCGGWVREPTAVHIQAHMTISVGANIKIRECSAQIVRLV
jgi:hypothetical protein